MATVNPPSVTGDTPTQDTTPTWNWQSGGGSGTGVYRYKLDDGDLSTGAAITVATSHAPTTSLAAGMHTLFAQEMDQAGVWSASGWFTIEVITGSAWIRQIGTSTDEMSNALAIESLEVHVATTTAGGHISLHTFDRARGDLLRSRSYTVWGAGVRDIEVVQDGADTFYFGQVPGADTRLLVTRVDRTTDTLAWTKLIDLYGPDRPAGVCLDEQRIYAMGVNTDVIGLSKDDLTFWMLDRHTGGTLLVKPFGGFGDEVARAMILEDGFLWVTGSESSDSEIGGTSKDLLIMKVAPQTGGEAWRMQCGSSQEEEGVAVALKGPVLYVLGIQMPDTPILLALDPATGSLQWSRSVTFPASASTQLYGLQVAEDRVFIMGSRNHEGSRDFFILALMLDGTVSWIRYFGGTGEEMVARSNSHTFKFDGFFLYVAGTESSDGFGGGKDGLIMKVSVDQTSNDVAIPQVGLLTGVSCRAITQWGSGSMSLAPQDGNRNAVADAPEPVGAVTQWSFGLDSFP